MWVSVCVCVCECRALSSWRSSSCVPIRPAGNLSFLAWYAWNQRKPLREHHLNHFSCSQHAPKNFPFHLHASSASVFPLWTTWWLSDSNFQWKMNNEHCVGHRALWYTIKCVPMYLIRWTSIGNNKGSPLSSYECMGVVNGVVRVKVSESQRTS